MWSCTEFFIKNTSKNNFQHIIVARWVTGSSFFLLKPEKCLFFLISLLKCIFVSYIKLITKFPLNVTFFFFVSCFRHLTLWLSTIKIDYGYLLPTQKKRLRERTFFNFCPTALKYAITYQKVRLGTGPYDNQSVSHTSASSMWLILCSHETFERPALMTMPTTTNNKTFY